MDIKKIIVAIVAVVAVVAIAISVIVLNKDTETLHTISFDTNGGAKVASQKIETGEKVTKPADPTKDGYEFLGWFLNGVYFDFDTPVEGDLKLEARWKELIVEDDKTEAEKPEEDKDKPEDNKDDKEEEKEETEKVTKYTVKFDSNGGSKVASKTVEKNKTVKAPTDPTREGYIFKGWYLGDTKYNFSKKVTKNITLVAHWEKVEEPKPEEPDVPVTPDEPDTPVIPEVKEYTVTFNTDGGSSVKAQTVKENETASKPSNPTKDGYTFKGWYLDGKEYNFSSKVTKNITLTAKWEKEKEDVIGYYISEPISTSVFNQVRVYITLNGKYVAGTADIVDTQGETVRREIPASGWLTVAGTIADVKNITIKK